MTIQILDESNSVVFQGSTENFISRFLDEQIPETSTKAWVIGILRERLHVCGAECKRHHVSIRKLYDDMREKGLLHDEKVRRYILEQAWAALVEQKSCNSEEDVNRAAKAAFERMRNVDFSFREAMARSWEELTEASRNNWRDSAQAALNAYPDAQGDKE